MGRERCEIPGCKNTGRVTLHRKTGRRVCRKHRQRWTRHGSYDLPPKRQKPAVCQAPECTGTVRIMRHGPTGIYACANCHTYWRRFGTFTRKTAKGRKFRPALLGKCENQCGYTGELRHIPDVRAVVCPGCYSYYIRTGDLPNLTLEARHRRAQGATCECGKPATRPVKLSGAMLPESRDVTPRVQSWTEYLCDDCYEAEKQLRNWQPPNEYRPGALIARD